MTPDQFGTHDDAGRPAGASVGRESGALGSGTPANNRHDAVVLAAARSAGEQIHLQRVARRGRLRAAAVAAACVLGVGLWGLPQRTSNLSDRPAEATVEPGGRTDSRIAAQGWLPADDMVPADGATLSRAPAHLAWNGRAGPGPYRVSLHSTDDGLTWRSGPIDEPQVALPAELNLLPGATYLWAVEPQRPGAQALGPYNFRITEPAPPAAADRPAPTAP